MYKRMDDYLSLGLVLAELRGRFDPCSTGTDKTAVLREMAQVPELPVAMRKALRDGVKL